MQHYKLLTGDVMETLKNLPPNHFDAVLSDPPYGISFMGKEWDKGVPSSEVYTELMRVLKPGAFGLHFGGTRRWHRLAVNLEEAGFELRDTLMWIYGSGFPKSHNISKALEAKARTGSSSPTGQRKAAMGESYAPTPLAGTPGYGTTGNFSSKYTGSTDIEVTTPAAKQWDGYGTALKPAWEPALLVQKPLEKTFAYNALTHGCGGLNVDGCRVGDDVNRGDRYNGKPSSNGSTDTGALNVCAGGYSDTWEVKPGRFPANLILDEEAGEAMGEPSRFFYCAKVSTKERNAGLGDGFPAKNHHPTLKPLALTEYLAKLLLVPKRTDGQPRRIIVPFSGAGSEVVGCLLAGWDEVWGIELNGDYVKIAKARITHHCPEARPDIPTCDKEVVSG